MKSIIEDGINEYNAIFADGKKDLRIECREVEDVTLECMALDGIQLCAYCVIGMTDGQEYSEFFNKYSLIEWRCVKRKSTSDYIFYPWIHDTAGVENIMKSLQVEQCEKYGYVNNPEDIIPKGCKDDFHCYRTCTYGCTSGNVESVKIATDIMLNINRNGKKIEELEQLSKILCCCKLDIMHSFFSCMQKIVSKLDKLGDAKEKGNLCDAIKKFYEDVVDLREKIDKKDYSVFREIEETSMEIAQLFRERKGSDKYVLNDILSTEASFSKKLENFFACGSKWTVRKKISGRSCESYMREIERLNENE